MKPLTREWVAKAEGDFPSCLRETRAPKNPNHDSACFHAQQCVEKYLKGLLTLVGVDFPRTHDLVALLSLVPAAAGLAVTVTDLGSFSATGSQSDALKLRKRSRRFS